MNARGYRRTCEQNNLIRERMANKYSYVKLLHAKCGLERLQIPKWAKPMLDERFNEQARLVGKLPEIELLRLKRFELDDQLKQKLAPRLYQLLLEWEESLNHRNALEKERMYLAGVKDGMKFLKALHAVYLGRSVNIDRTCRRCYD